MKIIIPGGNGQVGRMLTRAFVLEGHECVILTRSGTTTHFGARAVAWDGRTLGPWAAELDGADVVINLAGRSVDCRYHARNLAEMMASRVESTRVIGQAIAQAKNPPRIWLQASTATIYAHRFDAPNDEATGIIGGHEPGVPALWAKSIAIAQAWEAELAAAPTPRTRKVALRSAMTMSPDRGGVFSVLARHCRLRFGRFGDGQQFVSWIHEHDFIEAVKFLIDRDDLAGAFNLCAPHPLPNRDFISELSLALGAKLTVPVPRWALEIGTWVLRTETELILKSRRVVPGRLLEVGFKFRYPAWAGAVRDLLGTDSNTAKRMNPQYWPLRVFLELFGPAGFGILIYVLLMCVHSVHQTTHVTEIPLALLTVLLTSPIIIMVGFAYTIIPSVIYTLIMEFVFWLGLSPRSWWTVLLSTLLGRGAGYAIVHAKDILQVKLAGIEMPMVGTAVGLVLGLTIVLSTRIMTQIHAD